MEDNNNYISESSQELRKLLVGMRIAYANGENAMEYARQHMSKVNGKQENCLTATLVAYDLQAGNYIDAVRRDPEFNRQWCTQIAELIHPYLPVNGTLLEVGVGEATTLSGVLKKLGSQVIKAYGFDISWSRVAKGQCWLTENSQKAELFVGDLFNIPIADNSVDVVYTSHSLEPNGGRESAAIYECLRVARHAVVFIEPIYELASPEAQVRMMHHGYIRGIRDAAEKLGAIVDQYKLLDIYSNPLNPSGVLLLQKKYDSPHNKEGVNSHWRCPLTGSVLHDEVDCYTALNVGIVYPVLRGIPLLRSEHSIVASSLHEKETL